MEGFKDPILSGKSVGSDSGQGQFLSIKVWRLQRVAAYLDLVLKIARSDKEISAMAVLSNLRSFFSDYELRSRDALWMHHCAGTFRELIDLYIPGDFRRALTCLPKEPGDSLYVSLRSCKNFFNNLAHFNPDALSDAREVLVKSVREVDADIFDLMCAKTVTLLFELFVRNCSSEKDLV